jgi:hypothetical protein
MPSSVTARNGFASFRLEIAVRRLDANRSRAPAQASHTARSKARKLREHRHLTPVSTPSVEVRAILLRTILVLSDGRYGDRVPR